MPTEKPIKLPHDARQWINDQILSLKSQRLLLGRSQVDVSASIGCGENAVGDWERGKRAPRLDQWLAWRRALGMRAAAPQTATTAQKQNT
jgi:hypothetical protein